MPMVPGRSRGQDVSVLWRRVALPGSRRRPLPPPGCACPHPARAPSDLGPRRSAPAAASQPSGGLGGEAADQLGRRYSLDRLRLRTGCCARGRRRCSDPALPALTSGRLQSAGLAGLQPALTTGRPAVGRGPRWPSSLACLHGPPTALKAPPPPACAARQPPLPHTCRHSERLGDVQHCSHFFHCRSHRNDNLHDVYHHPPFYYNPYCLDRSDHINYDLRSAHICSDHHGDGYQASQCYCVHSGRCYCDHHGCVLHMSTTSSLS